MSNEGVELTNLFFQHKFIQTELFTVNDYRSFNLNTGGYQMAKKKAKQKKGVFLDEKDVLIVKLKEDIKKQRKANKSIGRNFESEIENLDGAMLSEKVRTTEQREIIRKIKSRMEKVEAKNAELEKEIKLWMKAVHEFEFDTDRIREKNSALRKGMMI